MAHNAPLHRHNQPTVGQGVVRRNALEKSLADFHDELAIKVYMSIERYHHRYIAPRLWRLEHPYRALVNDLWDALVRLWAWVRRQKVAKPKPEAPKQEATASIDAEGKVVPMPLKLGEAEAES